MCQLFPGIFKSVRKFEAEVLWQETHIPSTYPHHHHHTLGGCHGCRLVTWNIQVSTHIPAIYHAGDDMQCLCAGAPWASSALVAPKAFCSPFSRRLFQGRVGGVGVWLRVGNFLPSCHQEYIQFACFTSSKSNNLNHLVRIPTHTHSYRELARERGIARPQIICSRSAHGALDKVSTKCTADAVVCVCVCVCGQVVNMSAIHKRP